MKYLFFVFACCSAIISSAQSSIDVLHYKFQIEVSDKSDTIYGNTAIQIKFNRPTSTFDLDIILQNEKGKGMIIDSIIGNGIRGFAKQKDKIQIFFLKPHTDTAVVSIRYHGIPNDGLIISKNPHSDRTFFADNWPNRAHNWIPCVDDLADKASFEFWVTAPSHYKVVSNGILSEEKISGDKKLTIWKEDIPLPTVVMVIGIARFAVKIYPDSPAGIPVSAWVFAEDSAKGFKNYSYAPAIVEFFSKYIAPYPYKKLANVQSRTIFGGMENASAIFYYQESAIENRSIEDLLAHEIAHQWFGDMATEKRFSDLWLSEGFATYFTNLYLESKYGTDSMSRRLSIERKEVIEFARSNDNPVVDSISLPMALLNANSYQKGGWVLHMLRRQLGDSVFHEIIRRYYNEYKGKNAETADLKRIAEQVSKTDLTIFFNQWLYTGGIPKLNITWQYLPRTKEIKITIVQLQKNVFRFPLELKINNSAQALLRKVQINQSTETFKISVPGKPTSILPDPFTSLLFEGSIIEIN
jgi:aminopeptidase N